MNKVYISLYSLDFEIVVKNHINQSISPRTLWKPPKAAKKTKGLDKLNTTTHRTCLSVYSNNWILKEKDKNIDESSTIWTDKNSLSNSQIIKSSQINKFGIFSSFKANGNSGSKNTPKK